MKNVMIGLAISSLVFAGCNNGNTTKETKNTTKDSTPVVTADSGRKPAVSTTSKTPIDGLLGHYIDLKNALVADNGSEAARHGKELVEALSKFDRSSLNNEQKKVFTDISDDYKEMAEHISTNAGKIAHQREHFDMMSTDMYDLVKVIKPQQALYVDHCPKYNGGKGAIWLSETKDIKNPYMGKSMPECGTVKEELKP